MERPVSYISKSDPAEARRFGFIAQELQIRQDMSLLSRALYHCLGQELEQALPDMVRTIVQADEPLAYIKRHVLWTIMLCMDCGLLTDRQVNVRHEDKEERSLA